MNADIYKLADVQSSIQRAEAMSEQHDEPYCVWRKEHGALFTVPDNGDRIEGATMIYSTEDGTLL